MLAKPISDLLLLIIVPWGILLIYFYVYSRALISAIAFARDEQNRITPNSAWHFFEIKFYAGRHRRAGLFLLALILSSFISALPMVSGFQDLRIYGFTAFWIYNHLGFAALALGIIRFIAPRFQNPATLAGTGWLLSGLIWMTVWVIPRIWDRLQVLVILFPHLGMGVYFLSRWVVQKKPSEAWFRIES